MANDFYNSPIDIEPLTRARSVDINTIDQAIDLAFDKLPTEAQLKQGTINYVKTTGTAAAYVATLPHAPAGYTDGLLVSIKIHAANTGADPTVNVNGLGAKAIKRTDGTSLAANDLPINGMVDMRYNADTGFFHVSTAATAAAHASTAQAQAGIATAQAGIATAASGTATTKAGEAAASATASAGSATTATTQAGIATTQAGIATNKAADAETARAAAVVAKAAAETSEGNALTYKNAAEAAAAAASGASAFSDSNAIVKGSVDQTKRLRIEVDNNVLTGVTRVLEAPTADGTISTEEHVIGMLNTNFVY